MNVEYLQKLINVLLECKYDNAVIIKLQNLLSYEFESNYLIELIKSLGNIIDCDDINISDLLVFKIIQGSGGDDSSDLCSIFYQVFLLFFQKLNIEVEELGYEILIIKNIPIFKLLYSYENLVYKVIRISPYCNKKQTSFLKVDFQVVKLNEFSNFNLNDLRFDYTKASGSGGQHINKTNSAVRCIHTPSGISVFISTDRSQHKNKKLAIIKLKQKLDNSIKDSNEKSKLDKYRTERKISWNNFDRIVLSHKLYYVKNKEDMKKYTIDKRLNNLNLFKIIFDNLLVKIIEFKSKSS